MMRLVKRRQIEVQGASPGGAIRIAATVRNPMDPRRAWHGSFVVDPGYTDSVVPAEALRGIGLAPRWTRTYQHADGQDETVGAAAADLELMDDFVAATVCFGEDGVTPILGMTALASIGVQVAPVSRVPRRWPVPSTRAA